MLALAKDYKSITFPPSIDWINKLKALSSRIKALRLDLPTGDVPKGGCGGLKAVRRDLPTAHVPRGIFGPLDLPDLLACADSVVDDIESAITAPDPVAPVVDPLVDQLEEQGQNLQEQEEEEEEEEEEKLSLSEKKDFRSTTAEKASSSAFSRAAPTRYVIYPTIGAFPAQLSSISSALSSTIGTQNMATMELSASATVFVAMMDASMANIWKDDPVVTIKDASGGNMYSHAPFVRPYTFNEDGPPPPELRFVSTPPGISVESTTDYDYNPIAGNGISVYIIDTGIYPENSEFANLPGGYRWLWPTQKFWNGRYNSPHEEDDPFGHGTCVTSKVVGQRLGVAKKATAVIVKWIFGGSCSWELLILESLTRVRKDILTKGLQGKAVINMSFGKAGEDDQEYIAALEAVLEDLVKELDVVVVIAAGNTAKQQGSLYVNEYPALIRRSLTDIIVVGSVYVDGSRDPSSQTGPLVDIYAPGAYDPHEGIDCASSEGDGWVQLAGTSFATPAVTGLVAYLLSVFQELGDLTPMTGLTAQKVKAKMLSPGFAYARQQDNVAIYNGYSLHDDYCSLDTKRDVIGKRQCQNPTKATYTIDGVALTGVPTSLSGGRQTITAGGPPITISDITFSLPVLPSNGAIYVDGTLTHLPAANATATVTMSSSTPAMQHHDLTSSTPSTTARVLTSSILSYPSPTESWNVASYTGPSLVVPSTWCDLTLSTNGATLTRTYSTASGATTSYCAYNSIPASTITLSTVKHSPPPLSTSTTSIWNVASYTGPETVIPATWCDLTIAAASTSLTQTYSTISGASTSYCVYTAVPDSTISLSTLKPPAPPSSTPSTIQSTLHMTVQTSTKTTTSSITTSSTTTKPTFDFAGSTTLCHATFGTWSDGMKPTSVPRLAYTGSLNSYVDDFCTTTQESGITIGKGDDYRYGFAPVKYTPNPTPPLEPGFSTYYEFAIFMDPREECENLRLFDVPVIEPIVLTGPDSDCWDPLQQLVNGCDWEAGLDKWGGTIERACIIYGFQAWVGPTISDPPPYFPCGHSTGKRAVC